MVLTISLAGLAFPAIARAGETMLDDFEASNAASRWTFFAGSEFPGAKGSFTTAQGHTGRGGRLVYDFSGGGKYVSATLRPSSPFDAVAVAFWVKAQGGIHVTLRVVDATDQTLQYDLSRPFDALDDATWFRPVVALDAPTSHFDGASDGVVHRPFKALSILASDPVEPKMTGALDVDDVVALDDLSTSLDPRSAVRPAPADAAKLEERLGVNVHFTSDDPALDLARAAGFSFVRMDLGWQGVERTKGVYDFSALDGLVASLAARGMRLHLIVDYANTLYPAPGSASFGSTTVTAFANLTRATASHFAGKGVTYEIWNEPNLEAFWSKPNGAHYAALCKAAVEAVHQGDPSAKVSTAGIAGFDYAFLRAYLSAGGAQGADAIGVHPYRKGSPETLTDELVRMRSVVTAALGRSVPIWDTEWGYSSTWFGDGHDATARETQARMTVRAILSAWASGFPFIVDYDLRDDGVDPRDAEHNFGLMANDNGDKPAIVAVRRLTTAARDRSFVGTWDLAPSSLHAMRLDGANDTLAVVWTDTKGAERHLRIPAGASGVSMLGAPLSLTFDGGSPEVVVRESDGPIYLTFPRDSSDGGATEDGGTNEETTSRDAGLSDATASEDSTSGCGCRVGGDRSSALAGLGVTASLLAMVVRRRRSRRGS